MPRPNAERFIEAAFTATSASQAPDPSLCPRCRRPLMDPFGLGLCSACGYCHSLQGGRTPADLRKETASASTALDTSDDTVTPQGGRRTMRPWLVSLSLSCASVLLGAFWLARILSPAAGLRLQVGWGGSVLGFTLLVGAHCWALRLINGQEDNPAPTVPKHRFGDFVPVWRRIVAALPRTRGPLVALGLACSLVLGGGLLLAGYSSGDKERAARELKEAAERARLAKKKQREIEQAIQALQRLSAKTPSEVTSPRPRPHGGNAGTPPRVADTRPMSPCVILGYQTNSSKQLTGILLATLQNGKLHYAGVLRETLDLSQRIQLQLQLSSRGRPGAVLDGIKESAVWVRPEVFCWVHHSGTSVEGFLSKPRLGPLVQE